MGPGVPDPSNKCDDERSDGPPDPECAEPVIFLALVEDDLQGAGPDNEKAEADVVECADFGVLDVGRVVDEADDHEDGQNPHGNIDVEGVPPGKCVCEPAAECGSEDRGDDDAEAVGGHGHGALGDGKALQQDGLGKRLQGTAACSLKNAREEDDAEGRSCSAEKGGDGEDDDAEEQETLAAKAAGEPVGGG